MSAMPRMPGQPRGLDVLAMQHAVVQLADRIDHFSLKLPPPRAPTKISSPIEVAPPSGLLETGQLLEWPSRQNSPLKFPLRADDQRLRNPLHPFERAQKEAVELSGLHMTVPAL